MQLSAFHPGDLAIYRSDMRVRPHVSPVDWSRLPQLKSVPETISMGALYLSSIALEHQASTVEKVFVCCAFRPT